MLHGMCVTKSRNSSNPWLFKGIREIPDFARDYMKSLKYHFILDC